MTSIAAYITALYELIEGYPLTAAEGLLIPVARLGSAVIDIRQGRAPEIFKPVISRQDRTSLVQANVKAIAARAVDELIADGATLDNACRLVYRAIRAGKVVGWYKCTQRKVKDWRARIKEGDGSVTAETLMRYRAPLPPEAGSSSASRAAYLIKALRESPVLRHG